MRILERRAPLAVLAALITWTGAAPAVPAPLAGATTSPGEPRTRSESAGGKVIREKGTLKSSARVEIQSRVQGEATIRWVAPEGKVAKKGTLLVELDPGPLEEKKRAKILEVEKARSAVAEAELLSDSARDEGRALVSVAERRLALAEGALRAFASDSGEFQLELKAAERETMVAERRLEVARRRLELLGRLRDSPEGEIQIEEAELGLVEARAEVDAARSRLRFLGEHVRAQRIAELELGVAESRLELTRAKSELARAVHHGKARLAATRSARDLAAAQLEHLSGQIKACRIQAPRDGTVIHPRAVRTARRREPARRPGEVVREGQTILVLVDTTRLEISLQVPLETAQGVTTGQTVKVLVDAFPDRTFEGHISHVRVVKEGGSPVTEGAITVRVDDPTGALKPGMTAVLELEVASLEER